MSLYKQIQADLKDAMKQREALKLSVLRMVVSEIKYAEIDATSEMGDEQVEAVLAKEMKKRRDSHEAYLKADRQELAQKESQEMDIISAYLPDQMGEDEVKSRVEAIVAAGNYNNFGEAMGAVMKELKGKADGKLVSSLLKTAMKK